MSRDDGFATVDVDVGLLHDPKVIKLARELRDETRTAAHIGLYIGLLAESWRNGERVRLEDSLPAWWMGDVAPYVDALRQAGLIDAEARIRNAHGKAGSALPGSVAIHAAGRAESAALSLTG